jgi:hypothetical protein|tara:strand:- start:35 stop:202 length:168 start_codon:yes stop_codon:yes gene_type:complete
MKHPMNSAVAITGLGMTEMPTGILETSSPIATTSPNISWPMVSGSVKAVYLLKRG